MPTSFAERDTGTVNSKGQVTIPKHLRDEWGLSAGDEVRFVGQNGRLVMMPRNRDLEDLLGSLKSPLAKPLTVEEMKDIAADGWAFGEPDESEWATEAESPDARTA